MGVNTAERFEEATEWGCLAEQSGTAGSKTILLVEDEVFVRAVTCEVLQSAGYRVLPAKNAVEAVRVYEQCGGEMDLLLTDVVLPGETGRALAARLRRRNPGLKILLVTGYAEQMGLREGNQECLAKPYSTEVLLRRVRQRLNGVGLRCETVKLIRHSCDNG